MKYWIMKSEPEVYSIDDLAKEGETIWTGVRNYQARNFMRDEMRVGDRVLFYHSNAKPPAIVGLAQVSELQVVDPTQFDANSEHYDPSSQPESPRWICVKIKFIEKWRKAVTRDDLKAHKKLSGLAVLRKGQRLSILPVTKEEFEAICELANR
ncbi:MAG: EVE domain-containing protein [Bdellovibrionaceae bacterium]|nr:EVE domain-containing protein [Pseudobdellovibrionaceae bacterium]